MSKRTKVKKQKKIGIAVKLILVVIIAIVILMILGVSYMLSKFSKVETVDIKSDELMINAEVEEANFGEGYFNVVLFGLDSREGTVEQGGMSDTIIIASLNNETKEVKMVSVYRDTYLNLTNGSYGKCNGAYNLGGPTQAVNMLNTNLDLNLEKYVTVDFTIVTDIIDILGGIELEIDEYEIEFINDYIGETARVAGKERTYIGEAGVQLLNGVQATTYARIRKTKGGDFKRTDRQRYVIEQMVEKIKHTDLGTINEVIDAVLPRVSTNFTPTEIAYYAAAYLDINLGPSTGFPQMFSDAMLPSSGSTVIPATLKSNVITLHEFLFPEIEYAPSSQVNSNSNTIISHTQQYTGGVGNSNMSYDTHSKYSITNELLGREIAETANGSSDKIFNNPELVFN